MLLSEMTLSQILGLGVVWGIGTVALISPVIFYLKHKITHMIQLKAEGTRTYLESCLREHRQEAGRMVGQNVDQGLKKVEAELKQALSDLSQAETAQSEAETAQSEAETAQSVAETAQSVAETATLAKTDFLSRMSHEIRTPINGIMGSLQLLEPSPLTPQQNEDLQRALISGQRLLKVVNEILDIAKVETGRVQIGDKEISLSQVAQGVIEELEPLAQQKGLDLVLDTTRLSVPDRRGDAQKIHQILANLISNAIKFSPQGAIRLAASDQSNQISFKVTDQGPGISIEDQKQLFEPFVTSSQQVENGSGLGLSICQLFAQAMGGTVSVESELGVGSTFEVKLPLAEAENRPTEIRVMSVDDDEINRRVLERHLQNVGCQVTSCTGGQQAVETFDSQTFDLILMDLLMPGLDGFETTTQIRQLEKEQGRARTKIVALTASIIGEVENACREVGMDGLLEKPFATQELEEVLQSVRGI